MKRQVFLFAWFAAALLLFSAGCASTPTTAVVHDSPAPDIQAGVYPSPGINPMATQGAQLPATGPTGTSPAAASGQIICEVVADKSQAMYKVREQLANVSLPSDAIGKTSEISGKIAINPDGSVDKSVSKFEVGLASLQSDRSQRDNFVGRNILQTSQFPSAVFIPTQADGFPSPLPQSGQVAFKLTGDLTVRSVTKPVTFEVTGTIDNNTFTGTATTSFTFEDFELTQPRVPVVLSVVDKINLELDITLQRVSQ
jgi:polyisoprenoid-binding protein YceI